MSGAGKFTVSLQPHLTGAIGSYPNISTNPTMKLVFNDPAGTMTLADLPGNLPQLEAIQFPALGLSATGLSETWAPLVSSFQLGHINAADPPDPCKGGCKYSFTLNGKIQGIPLTSPLASYNGYYYSAAGDFFNNGALNFGQLRIDSNPVGCGPGCINAAIPPDSCSSGCLVAADNPEGCKSGCKFNLTLNPSLLFSHSTLGTVNTTPTIKLTFDNPTGALTLNNLQGSLTSLQSVAFPSLALNAGLFSESWAPTVTTYSLVLASVPPPASIITVPLNNALLNGVSTTIIGTANDIGGPGLQKVELGITPSGGTTTWHPATDTSGSGNWSTWSYAWSPIPAGNYTIQSRGTDNTGNVETPTAGVGVTAAAIVKQALTFSAGTGGSILGAASQSVSSDGNGTPVMAVAAAGYSFVNWTCDNGFIATVVNPLIVANPTAGYHITANFMGVPALTSSVTAKNGAQNARVWTITLSNAGTATALNARISGFSLTQTAGAACTPVISAALPINLGNIPQGSSVAGNLTIDFTGCASTAKFTSKTTFSANGGSITGSNTLNNQFR